MKKFKHSGINQASRFIKHNGVIVAFVLIFVFASVSYDSFFKYQNLSNVLRQSSINGLIAIGMTFIILGGGIDLSVGSVVALSGVIAAKMSSTSLLLAIVVPIGVGAVVGLINGLLVTRVRMEPFVATMSTMMGIRGVAYIITGEVSVGIDKASDAFTYLGRGEIFDLIPVPSLFFIFILLVSAYVLKYTYFGRNVYAVGGNLEAAKMMGVRVNVTRTITYSICGGLSGFAGLVLAARLGAGQPVAGEGYELRAIASVVLGGTYLTGGVGKMSGTFIGVMIMGLITNIFNMQGNISTWWQNVIMGLLLLIVVLIQSITVNGINMRKKLA